MLIDVETARGAQAESRRTATRGADDDQRLRIRGRQLLVDDQPFHMKGMNWNPIPWGGRHPLHIDYKGFVLQDGDLMARADVNTVRTYEPITDWEVLDQLWEYGIWVMNTVYGNGAEDPHTALDAVNKVKDHPAILMWVIGNEWNYNGIYADLSKSESIERINTVARLVKEADPKHLVSSVYGGLPSAGMIGQMPDIDIWGINYYNGGSFGNLFRNWEGRSGKPMYIGEYGADAFNAYRGSEDQMSQADATKWLTGEIAGHSSAHGGSCLGGLLFEFADEWWKDGNGVGPADHDIHGKAPGAGPHPDKTFNEEWWGIVDINRRPREAYYAFRDVENPGYTGKQRKLSNMPSEPPICDTSQVQRRRRHGELCACRRRMGTVDLPEYWECVGSAITPLGR
jgi:hypothetical protein